MFTRNKSWFLSSLFQYTRFQVGEFSPTFTAISQKTTQLRTPMLFGVQHSKKHHPSGCTLNSLLYLIQHHAMFRPLQGSLSNNQNICYLGCPSVRAQSAHRPLTATDNLSWCWPVQTSCGPPCCSKHMRQSAAQHEKHILFRDWEGRRKGAV